MDARRGDRDNFAVEPYFVHPVGALRERVDERATMGRTNEGDF
jgi:hypothetical protein